jgi:hypothetical protein
LSECCVLRTPSRRSPSPRSVDRRGR